jgi:hypothetical protein
LGVPASGDEKTEEVGKLVAGEKTSVFFFEGGRRRVLITSRRHLPNRV